MEKSGKMGDGICTTPITVKDRDKMHASLCWACLICDWTKAGIVRNHWDQMEERSCGAGGLKLEKINDLFIRTFTDYGGEEKHQASFILLLFLSRLTLNTVIPRPPSSSVSPRQRHLTLFRKNFIETKGNSRSRIKEDSLEGIYPYWNQTRIFYKTSSIEALLSIVNRNLPQSIISEKSYNPPEIGFGEKERRYDTTVAKPEQTDSGPCFINRTRTENAMVAWLPSNDGGYWYLWEQGISIRVNPL
ncbi:hypothetical protein V1477_008631, partial [Vespula maculifrons]